MKNKKITYFVLLPSVLFIWGMIVYRILNGRSEDYIPIQTFNNTRKLEVVPDNFEYQLLKNYKDPFSSQEYYSNELYDTEAITVETKIQKKWPKIRLNGYIVNGTKIKCHLTVNEEDKILQENEKVLEDFFVSRITPDSIKISCKNDSRWYKK